MKSLLKNRNISGRDLSRRLKWLMFCRLIFSIIVIAGIYIVFVGTKIEYVSVQVVGLYFFSAFITILSLFYAFLFKYLKDTVVFAVVQIIIDTFLVTFLIYFTGVLGSVFQFFYLVIILYSSSVFTIGKPYWIACLVSTQYGLLVNLKYYGYISDFLFFKNNQTPITEGSIFFQLFFFIISSFAVAWLANLFSVQARRARDDLKEMNEYVKSVEKLAYAGEIAAGFAHEIKNPMASLRGSIQLLLSDIKKNRKDDVVKLGDIILRESDRLDELVNSFLFFARPGFGDKKKLNPLKEISDLVNIFKQDNRVKDKINIFVNMENDFNIEIDSGHFKQIIWNILINALEASYDNGEIYIELKKKKGSAEISIEDMGEGIKSEIKDRIFDPFFSTKKKGSGLGLSIVARLMELYDGIIDLEQGKNGIGTKVILLFDAV